MSENFRGNHRGWLLKTGADKPWCHQFLIALEDGHYEMGISRAYRLLTEGQYSGTTSIAINGKTESKSNNCVLDLRTGLMWSRYLSNTVGPSSNGSLYWDNHIDHLVHDGGGDPWVVNEVVTQATSNATGVIRYVDNGDNEFWLENVEGTFDTVSGYAITGSEGGGGSGTCLPTSYTTGNKEDIHYYANKCRMKSWQVITIGEFVRLMKSLRS